MGSDRGGERGNLDDTSEPDWRLTCPAAIGISYGGAVAFADRGRGEPGVLTSGQMARASSAKAAEVRLAGGA